MLEVNRSSVSHLDQMVVTVSPPHLCYILCCNYRGGGEKIRKKRAMDAEGEDHRYTDKETLVHLILGVIE